MTPTDSSPRRSEPLVEQGPQAFPNPDSFTEPTRDGFYDLHHEVH